jgi:tripartite-type tricarboxylate transporter receptor subunit TctC
MAASMVAAPAMWRAAAAQAYPSRPVRLVVGFGAGGTFDITGRIIAQWLGERLGQPVIVDNRPGAGSNIATEAVIRAPADGYTLLLGGAVNAVNATLHEKLAFDFMRDVAPVAGLIRFPNLMIVAPDFPARTVPEFIAHAKTNVGRINMSSGGTGTTQHLAGELFRMMTGVELVHVPYRGGGQSVAAVMGGEVQVAFEGIPATMANVRAGKLRALAVTTEARSETLPDVPTLAEFVPGYEASGWNGLCAPRNTPEPIVGKLNAEINAALADPAIKARFIELGGVGLGGSPAAFAKLIASETDKWGKVVKFAGVKPQ